MNKLTKRRRIAASAAALLIACGLGLWAASSASAATCTTSSASGACGPYDDPAVFQGPNGADLVVQNDFSAIPQTLTASGPTAWTVAASTVGQSDQTSVKSYPATQVTTTLWDGQASHPEPSSDFGTTLTSNFTNVIPAGSGQDFEYAVDDWLADPSKPSWTSDFELMIWTYTSGQRPAGNDTGQVYTDAAGTQWEVWVAGGATTVSPDSTVSFVRKVNAVSGSLDRWGFYRYLQGHGMLSATFGIDQTNYGLEICSTGGATRTYGISGYDLVVNGGSSPTPTPTTTSPTPTPTTTSPTPAPTPTSSSPAPTPTTTMWACVESGGAKLMFSVATAAPTCPAGSYRVSWPVQRG